MGPRRLIFIFISGLVILQAVQSKTYQTYNGYGKGFDNYASRKSSMKNMYGYPLGSFEDRRPLQSRNVHSLGKKLRKPAKKIFEIEPLILHAIGEVPRDQIQFSPKYSLPDFYRKGSRIMLPEMEGHRSLLHGKTIVPSIGYSGSKRTVARPKLVQLVRNSGTKSRYPSKYTTSPSRKGTRYESREEDVPQRTVSTRPTIVKDRSTGKEYFRFNRYSDTIEGKSLSAYLESMKDEAGRAYRKTVHGLNSEMMRPKTKAIYYSDKAGNTRRKLYDPCRRLPDFHYVLDARFQAIFSYADPECNFVKCANRKAYLNPCSIATRNKKDGSGFCSTIDLEGRCGISYYDAHEKRKFEQNDK